MTNVLASQIANFLQIADSRVSIDETNDRNRIMIQCPSDAEFLRLTNTRFWSDLTFHFGDRAQYAVLVHKTREVPFPLNRKIFTRLASNV